MAAPRGVPRRRVRRYNSSAGAEDEGRHQQRGACRVGQSDGPQDRATDDPGKGADLAAQRKNRRRHGGLEILIHPDLLQGAPRACGCREEKEHSQGASN